MDCIMASNLPTEVNELIASLMVEIVEIVEIVEFVEVVEMVSSSVPHAGLRRDMERVIDVH